MDMNGIVSIVSAIVSILCSIGTKAKGYCSVMQWRTKRGWKRATPLLAFTTVVGALTTMSFLPSLGLPLVWTLPITGVLASLVIIIAMNFIGAYNTRMFSRAEREEMHYKLGLHPMWDEAHETFAPKAVLSDAIKDFTLFRDLQWQHSILELGDKVDILRSNRKRGAIIIAELGRDGLGNRKVNHQILLPPPVEISVQGQASEGAPFPGSGHGINNIFSGMTLHESDPVIIYIGLGGGAHYFTFKSVFNKVAFFSDMAGPKLMDKNAPTHLYILDKQCVYRDEEGLGWTWQKTQE